MFDVYVKCQYCQWRKALHSKVTGCTMDLRFIARFLAGYCPNCHYDIYMMLEVQKTEEDEKEVSK